MSDATPSIYTPPAGPPAWIDEEDPAVRSDAPWAIDSPGKLDWSMARLAAITAELEQLKEQEAAAIRRVKHRAEKLRAALQVGEAMFTERITAYAEPNRATLLGGGKKKSRDLIHGRIGWRGGKERLVLKEGEAEQAALERWLERRPNLARITVEPNMKALWENYTATREIPPGMEHKAAGDTFYIEPVLPEAGLTVKESA